MSTREHSVPRRFWLFDPANCRRLVVLIVCFVLATAAAVAYTSSARTSLLRSRDEVADQRRQLERAYADIDRKINELQNQKYSIGRYLSDCDKTLRDIDRALSSQDAAYRGH